MYPHPNRMSILHLPESSPFSTVSKGTLQLEYGLNVNEKKSKVVCITGEVGRRRWMVGDCCMGQV